ncbi:hypothetical protein FDP41_000368 [Naegleria fowleri]|uniref:Uncharacterized protein n=1 Tax=Naegleria fowleri TaxID=5763 RepID=A0A6A5CGN9_NAEFO|nr:uncharacterized protein FDP41_000368 [Naegleria fowleri]KAF0984469.1 hypothetical protein FDP41_000368 [Naegleria fowleri]CAG4714883.1 unnamed protein product [Naegleria fowleri]
MAESVHESTPSRNNYVQVINNTTNQALPTSSSPSSSLTKLIIFQALPKLILQNNIIIKWLNDLMLRKLSSPGKKDDDNEYPSYFDSSSSSISERKAKHTSRNYYSFAHHIEETTKSERFEIHTMPYYRTLLRLNHLLMNDPFSYFMVLCGGLIASIIPILVVVYILLNLVIYWGQIGILGLFFQLSLMCILVLLSGVPIQCLVILFKKYPSPLHFLYHVLSLRKNKFEVTTSLLTTTPFSSQSTPLYYYSTEILTVTPNKGIQLEKIEMDISTMDDNKSKPQKANIVNLLLYLLIYHLNEENNQAQQHETILVDSKQVSRQFISIDDIQMIVIREGIMEGKSSGGTSAVNAHDQGGVVGSGNVGSNSAANAVVDPVSILLQGSCEMETKIRKTQDLAIIMKTIHSREQIPFETIRPKNMHLKLIYKKVRSLLQK